MFATQSLTANSSHFYVLLISIIGIYRRIMLPYLIIVKIKNLYWRTPILYMPLKYRIKLLVIRV